MYDPCNFCGYMSISDRQRGLCYEKCLYQQALAKARLYDSIPKIDIKQFKYDLWLARYGRDHNMTGRTMWQSTDKGRVNGIYGDVCLEFAFKDYAAMKVTDRSDYTPGTWEKVNEIWYFAHETGYYTGWVKPDGNWYYLDPANGGAMLANTTAVIDGVSYTFGPSGAMQ